MIKLGVMILFAETRKEVMVEYPISTVYESLISIFPVKYYNLQGHDPYTYSLNDIDSYNKTFTMKITLHEDTPDTTVISFLASYPHAVMDLTGGGKQAIETILEELLDNLDQRPITTKVGEGDIEVVTRDSFVNTSKNKTHIPAIVLGYVLCILSYLLTLVSLINYNPSDSTMAIFFVVGIFSLCVEISLSVVLQYYENSRTILHGRIQLCICGVFLIILGIIIHPVLIVAGIVIPLIGLLYFHRRSKAIN